MPYPARTPPQVPREFNAAAYFVDRNIDEGRGPHVALEGGSEQVTYHQLQSRVNRLGNALRELGVRMDVAAHGGELAVEAADAVDGRAHAVWMRSRGSTA